MSLFRILPDDHNGVAPILAHCVLGGSQKYPVREPSVKLRPDSAWPSRCGYECA